MPSHDDWVAGVVETINRPSRVVRLALWLAILMTVFCAAFFFLLKINRAVEGPAVVRPEGGTWIAQAPWRGRIAQILVEEGQAVKEGDPVYRMDVEELENGRSALEKQCELIEANIAALKQRIPQARTRGELAVRTANSEWKRAEAVRNQAKVAVAQAKIDLASTQDLLKIGSVPPRALTDAEAKVAKADADLSVSEQDVFVAEQRVAVAEKEAPREGEQLESQIRDSTRTLEENRHQLEETRRKIKEGVIRAARAGTVMRRIKAAPTLVEAATPLADIVPVNVRPTVEARIDAADVNDVKVGYKVRLRFSGRTDTLPGEVSFVSADAAVEEGRSFYRVDVRLDPASEHLPFGLIGRATISTGRATLAQIAEEWLLER